MAVITRGIQHSPVPVVCVVFFAVVVVLAPMVWYDKVWYGMVWYGMAWHGMIWHGMVALSSVAALLALLGISCFVFQFCLSGQLCRAVWHGRAPRSKRMGFSARAT